MATRKRFSWIALAVFLSAAGFSRAATPVPVAGQAELPRVVVLATGGTIAGSGGDRTVTVGYKAATLPVDGLLESVPELKGVARVRGEQVFQIASENMTPDHWLRLAKKLREVLASDEVDGVVITHGTDTMEETAFFLHLAVRSRKPVVLTGAMRPPTALSADGPINLFDAVRLAASPSARDLGVLVVMDGQIHSARAVTKVHTVAIEAFSSGEWGVLGRLAGSRTDWLRVPCQQDPSRGAFDVSKAEALPRVDIVYGYAGADEVAPDAAFNAGARGLVFAGTGDGSLPARVKSSLAEWRKKGRWVVRSTRSGGGLVVRNGEVDDDALGFIAADTFSPQKARVLLMMALAHTSDPLEIQRVFQEY